MQAEIRNNTTKIGWGSEEREERYRKKEARVKGGKRQTIYYN